MVARTAFVGHSPGNAGRLRPVVAAHIVTTERGEFVEARTISEGISEVTVTYPTPEALIRWFCAFSHRGQELLLYQADHDMRYLIPALEVMTNEGYEVTFTLDGQNRIIYCKIGLDKHRWYIRDVCAMLPLSMEELRALCSAPPGASTESVILRAYKAYGNTLRNTFNVRPSVTIGTTAVAAWTTTLPEGHIYYRQRPEVETFAREGYFGGMVWLRSQETATDCTYIDVNAMYAHAMRQGVPVRSGAYTDRFRPGQPGIYACRVYCPASVLFAFIPEHDANGIGVNYPRETWFDTVCTTPVIEFGREVGYQIEVGEGYVFDEIGHPFDTFVDRCEALEQEYKKSGAGFVIKALRNSLYGKFGMRDMGTEYCLSADDEAMISDDWTPVLTWEGEFIDHLWCRDVPLERGYMMPTWAAWITSTARVILARMVYALGPADCLYGDTDSIIVRDSAFGPRSDLVPLGPRYGEWKIKHRFTTFRAVAPKLYAAQTRGGEWIVIASGIKRGVLSPEEVARILPDGPPVYTKQYRQERRAIQTVGGRAHGEYVVKQITVPELSDPLWARISP